MFYIRIVVVIAFCFLMANEYVVGITRDWF